MSTNSSVAVRLTPDTERTLAYTSISGTYAKVGTALAYPAIMIILQNLTNEPVTFSFDGTNNHITLNGTTSFVLDCQSNRSSLGGSMAVAAGTQFWVSSSASPSSGSVYVDVFYGFNINNL